MSVMLMESIGQTVRRLRTNRQMTQQALAMAAGLSVSVVSQLEQGSNNDPRMSTLKALAKALDVTVDELVSPPEGEGGDEAESPGPPAPKKPRRKKAE
jgi:transcriptional regulator with XRE-family HTH domain